MLSWVEHDKKVLQPRSQWYNQIHIKPPTVKGTHVLNVNLTELELYEMNLIFADFVDVWTSENHLQT